MYATRFLTVEVLEEGAGPAVDTAGRRRPTTCYRVANLNHAHRSKASCQLQGSNGVLAGPVEAAAFGHLAVGAAAVEVAVDHNTAVLGEDSREGGTAQKYVRPMPLKGRDTQMVFLHFVKRAASLQIVLPGNDPLMKTRHSE